MVKWTGLVLPKNKLTPNLLQIRSKLEVGEGRGLVYGRPLSFKIRGLRDPPRYQFSFLCVFTVC
jgi:hypothetical protein